MGISVWRAVTGTTTMILITLNKLYENINTTKIFGVNLMKKYLMQNYLIGRFFLGVFTPDTGVGVNLLVAIDTRL